jgi:hypothetical protein
VFAQENAIGGNIVVHGCHFRLLFQTKEFQKNQSLERKATIVDAPTSRRRARTLSCLHDLMEKGFVKGGPSENAFRQSCSKTNRFHY